MSCGGGKLNFRLLDGYVGWEPTDPDHSGLEGFANIDEPDGIRLALKVPGAVDPSRVWSFIPPARLARGCGACEWYLITPFPPESGLLRRDACHRDWERVWKPPCAPEPFVHAAAVATWWRRVAVADRGANKVLVWARSGERLVAEISTEKPGPIAFTPYGDLLVASAGSPKVARYGLDGGSRGFLRASFTGTADRIAVDRMNRVWMVTKGQDGSWVLLRAGRDDDQFASVPAEELANAFKPTGFVAESDAGFCFAETGPDAMKTTSCYSWYGRPLCQNEVSPPPPPQREKQGQLLTIPLESRIPRCRWHRVRVDADIPPGTTLSMAVATLEKDRAPLHGDPSRNPDWSNFPAGQPHFSDWTSPPAGSLDFLIDQPPGRYLVFRMRFTGDGIATPVVRRVRIDFPRVTSLEHLPAVYREDPNAEDFTERFLSLFDASIADMDRVIERYPALLDPSGVPEQLLPWLGGFFDIGFEPTWNADKRRNILKNAPELYRRRGTIKGLRLAISLAFGVTPAIEELSSTGTWGAIASGRAIQAARCKKSGSQALIRRNVRLRSVRLFGKTRARFRLNRSPLSGAPLRSYGNPDQDPFSVGAYRFRILVPPVRGMTKEDLDRLRNLIEAQKPAHTVASVRVGGTGFLLGYWSTVGVDTLFAPLAPPLLGSRGNVRLNRMSILWNGPHGRGSEAAVGQTSVVGIQTIAG